MKETNIDSIFRDECAGLVIDSKLAKKIHNYQVGFVNKNQDHIAFFGGNLLGVQVVRFNPADRDRWFNEIVECDDGPLRERLITLPEVVADRKVSSDAMNLSCAWLVHAIHVSNKLTDAQKYQAKIDVLLVLQYKFLTSRLYRLFQYPADKAVAEATYAQLTYKYAIKQHGSWAKLLHARADEIIGKDTIHRNAIEVMDDDKKVVYLLNDTQGRIRDMLKNIYGVFLDVHLKGTKITSTSSIVEHDGVEILKDKSKNLLAYGRYLNAIVTDKNSFIRDELLRVIENLMHTMPPRFLRESLEYMSANYRQSRADEIEEVLNETLVHSFDYLSHNRDVIRNDRDLPGILSKLRGVYMSSRSTDPRLLALRKKTEKIVKHATGNKNESTVASVRTGILLYLVCRAFTMRHYTTGST